MAMRTTNTHVLALSVATLPAFVVQPVWILYKTEHKLLAVTFTQLHNAENLDQSHYPGNVDTNGCKQPTMHI